MLSDCPWNSFCHIHRIYSCSQSIRGWYYSYNFNNIVCLPAIEVLRWSLAWSSSYFTATSSWTNWTFFSAIFVFFFITFKEIFFQPTSNSSLRPNKMYACRRCETFLLSDCMSIVCRSESWLTLTFQHPCH